MVRISPEHADELVAVYREFNHREHDRMLKLYDGILDLLDDLHQAGVQAGPGHLQVALHHADGLRPHRHRALLRRHRLLPTRAPGNKPSPDPILFCLEQLGVDPADAAYVGDSPADIQAALRRRRGRASR